MTSETVFAPVAGQTILSMVQTFAKLTGDGPARLAYHKTMRKGPLCSNSMPCGGLSVADLFAGAFGDGVSLVLAHSPISLLTQDASPEKAARVVSKLASGNRGRLDCPRLPTGVTCGNRSDLRCPQCADKAFADFGFRPALREHVFDYVALCASHGCQLISDGAWSRLEACLIDSNPQARVNAMRYASAVSTFLQSSPQRPLRESIMSELRAKGFVTPEGHFRLAALDRSFSAFYSGGLGDARLTWLTQTRSVPAMFVRSTSRGRPVHAVLLILMHIFAREVDSLSPQLPLRLEPDYSPSTDVELIQSYRGQWQAHLAATPDLTRKEMRLALPGAWTWLYRHDREWLERHQVKKAKPLGGRKPAELPAPFLDAIRTSTVDFRYSDEGREPLPSSYQLRLGLGLTEHVFERTSRELGFGSSAQLPGRKQVFVTRRVDRAHVDLGHRSTSALAVVARAAKLRPETVAEYDYRR
ncbi:hypothetical protein [Caballeronia sp. ATUFL_M2_KS44]|uniref:hypothetical protein n=1 Tax=Caballeronia sp. ATUFL_M2_KS44 TaxID=2921767 RepID=UPI0020282933|nr:hypothetical protein [Caballeronia sp. ATUFL_M2_KS44]